MLEVKQRMELENIRVLLKEEQFSDRSIKRLTDKAIVVELDSLGQGKARQAKSYVEFMEIFVNDIHSGLTQAR